jgi:glutamyl-tRNA synthetase
MNGVYIRKLTAEEFFDVAQPYLMEDLEAGTALIADEEYVRAVLPLVQERAKTLADVPRLTRFFFELQLDLDLQTLIVTGMDVQSTREALEVVRKRLEKLEPFDADSLESLLRPLAKELGLKTGQLFGTLRVTSTGETAAPPLFDTMAVLGRERCLQRIDAALKML